MAVFRLFEKRILQKSITFPCYFSFRARWGLCPLATLDARAPIRPRRSFGLPGYPKAPSSSASPSHILTFGFRQSAVRELPQVRPAIPGRTLNHRSFPSPAGIRALLGIAYFLAAIWIWVSAATGDDLGIKPQARRPNILLIYTDDQSWRTLSCYREQGAWPWVSTPSIDRIAREGVRFTTCYGASWCTPSRVSLLTARYPHGVPMAEIGPVLLGRDDPQERRFWPSGLRKAGYETAMIGKWHIGPNAGHGHQWDHSVIWDQADIAGDWYNNQLLRIDGRPKHIVPGYSTDLYTRYATEFLSRERQAPWFLWLCYNAPHKPLTVHARHRALYAGAEVPIPLGVFGPREGVPAWQRMFTQWQPHPNGVPTHLRKPLPETVRDYNRLVATLDEDIGKILKTLDETRQLENTLLVFTSDQGFAWGPHGFAGKLAPYDECLRMPLLVRWPGVAQAGGVCEHPVTILDVAATLVRASGVNLPWAMHGHDLKPLLTEPDAPWSAPALMEHCRYGYTAGADLRPTAATPPAAVPWWVFLRSGPYKYIRTLVDGEIEELYDLSRDPGELHNLAQQPKHRARLQQLEAALITELRRTGASMANHLPKVRRADK